MTIRIPLYKFPNAAGEKWRPANSYEGERFWTTACDNCRHHRPDDEPPVCCKVLGDSLFYATTDERYPRELCYDAEGCPQCTAFSGNDAYRERLAAMATPELPFARKEDE